MFIGKWNRSVILTYIGLGFAVIGMYMAIIEKNALISFMCLMIAGVCDMFDGKVARMCKRNEEEIAFGIELDSLVDVVCFVVLPIIIYISLGFTSWYNVVSYIIFAICGIARLGYFNVCLADKDGKAIKYYEGLPVTAASITFPLIYLLSYIIPNEAFYILFSVLILLQALLNVLKIKIKKPSGVMYPFLSVCAVIMIIIYVVLL